MPKTAYGRLRDRIKKEEARQSQPLAEQRRRARLVTAEAADLPEGKTWNEKLEREEKIAKINPKYCNAKTRQGGKCKMPAGHGTPHPGIGACKKHGGMTPMSMQAAGKKIAVKDAILLGAPREINPLDAIIWCIQIKAGEVQWLSEKIVELDEKEWVEDSLAGRRFHLFARQRDEATRSLVDYSKIAISLGLAERAVKLAEQYGSMLANLIKGILGDLNLTAEQREHAPAIVRKHLILVQGGLAQGQLPPGSEEIAS